MHLTKFLWVFLFAVLQLNIAYSACTSPDGVAGEMEYNTTENRYEFCNGTSWFGLTGVTGVACSAEAALRYESGSGLEFCDGTNWISLMGSTGSGSSDLEGTMQYNHTSNSMEYSDGSDWIEWNASEIIPVSAPDCSPGFAFIPGSEGVDSEADGWCVSKYEMTPWNVSGWSLSSGSYNYGSSGTDDRISAKSGQLPISRIPRNQAATACASDLVDASGTTVSAGKLMTVALWKILNDDLTAQGVNWSSGTVGTGYMSRGHSNNNPAAPLATGTTDAFPAVDGMANDSTNNGSGTMYWSRTHQTSYGENIWDLTGNLMEIFSDRHNSNGTPVAWTEFTAGTYAFNGTSLEPTNSSWNSAHGIGQVYKPNSTSGTTYTALYGGHFNGTDKGGLYYSQWNNSASNSPSSTYNIYQTFRCVAPLP